MSTSGGMLITVPCTACGRLVEIKLTFGEFTLLGSEQRPHIQKILPNHTPEEREMFVSGICGVCWKEMYDEHTSNEEVES